MQNQFNPLSVTIEPKLNYLQVGLILEGLGKLPFERVDQAYLSLRDMMQTALTQAEQEFKEAQEKAGLPGAETGDVPKEDPKTADSEGGETE